MTCHLGGTGSFDPRIGAVAWIAASRLTVENPNFTGIFFAQVLAALAISPVAADDEKGFISHTARCVRMPALPAFSEICRSRHTALLALLLVLIARGAQAAPNDWNVRVWQPNDAQPNSKITGVVQTKDGYLWVGSYTGLARFDGVKFEQCKLDILPKDEASKVSALTRAHNGSLLVAFESGAVIQMDFGRAPKLICQLSDFKPTALVEDGAGAIWISSCADRWLAFSNPSSLNSLRPMAYRRARSVAFWWKMREGKSGSAKEITSVYFAGDILR